MRHVPSTAGGRFGRATLRTLALACAAGAVGVPASADPAGLWTEGGVPVAAAGYWHQLSDATADGSGGVFVGVWSGDGSSRVQHLDASGARLWGDDGVQMSYSATALGQPPRLVLDGAGGLIVAWLERRGNEGARVYVQRLDVSGARQWDAGGGNYDGIAISYADYYEGASCMRTVPDGEGGAVIMWVRGRGSSQIRVQRVASDGTPLWAGSGVVLHTTPDEEPLWDMEAVPDGAGGAIIAWQDLFLGGTDGDIRATRVDGTGVLAAGWPAAGLPLCVAPGLQHGVKIVTDGADGAFVTWSQETSPYQDPSIRGQRVLPDGSMPWAAADGIELVDVANMFDYSSLTVDGRGGFLFAWQLGSGDGNDTQMQIQRFGGDGAALWNAGAPVWLCDGAFTQKQIALAADGAGGAFAAWIDLRDCNYTSGEARTHVQRVAPDGTLLWGASDAGVRVSGPPTNMPQDPRLVLDGADGVIAMWGSSDESYRQSGIIAQRVAGSLGPVPLRQFLLPTKATIKFNAKKPARSTLTLSAVLDTGPDAATFSGAVQMRVGPNVYQLPAFALQRNGSLRSSAQGLDVTMRPLATGGSRCPLTLKLAGDDVGDMPTEGALEFELRCGTVDADGACVVRKGKFSIGGGGLPDGATALSAATATILGAGKDSFTAKFFIATGPAPSPAPDIAFSFGVDYERTIPGAQVRTRGSVLTFTDKTNALPSLTADFAKGVVVVTGRKTDLGAFPDGAQPVRFSIGPTAEPAVIEVRMVRKGRTLKY